MVFNAQMMCVHSPNVTSWLYIVVRYMHPGIPMLLSECVPYRDQFSPDTNDDQYDLVIHFPAMHLDRLTYSSCNSLVGLWIMISIGLCRGTLIASRI